MENLSDHDLMRLIVNKDTEAYKTLISRYETRIFNFLLRYTGNREIAQDLLQETFIRVWYAAHTHDPKRGMFKSWIFKIALNIARNELKKKHYNYQFIDLDDASEKKFNLLQSKRERPDFKSELSELKDMIMFALNKLQPFLREVVILKHYHQFTFREMAMITNTPEGTLKARFNKAITHLRLILKDFR